MTYLLDTCVFLWMLSEDERLSPTAKEAIAKPGNALHLSAASCWEIAIKQSIGRLTFSEKPKTLVPFQMERNGILPLAIEHPHALRTAELPRHHRDPFDRLLIAQAQVERLTILTPDPAFRSYNVQVFW